MITKTQEKLKLFYGKPLSGKALLGLADMAFFCFFDLDVEPLGIHFDKEQMYKKVSEMDIQNDRSFKEFGKMILYDYQVTTDERNAIGLAIKGLLMFKLSNVSRSMLNDQTMPEKLYVIFVFLQRKMGNSDLALDWLIANLRAIEASRMHKAEVRNSPENLSILCNTLLHLLHSNIDQMPLEYPQNKKFHYYVAVDLAFPERIIQRNSEQEQQ